MVSHVKMSVQSNMKSLSFIDAFPILIEKLMRASQFLVCLETHKSQNVVFTDHVATTYTHTHTHIHIYTHIPPHTYIRTHIHTLSHIHTLTHTHAHFVHQPPNVLGKEDKSGKIRNAKGSGAFSYVSVRPLLLKGKYDV